MNMNQVKISIATETGAPVGVLQFVKTFKTDPADPKNEAKKELEELPWLSAWDNINRRRVVMHVDVLAKLKENPDYDGLSTKYKLVENEGKEPYHMHTVITPKNLAAAF